MWWYLNKLWEAGAASATRLASLPVKKPSVSSDRRVWWITDSPKRRFTSVYDLDYQGGTVGISFKVSEYMLGLLPREDLVPFFIKSRSKNTIGSHQRFSRICNLSIVTIYPRMTTLDMQLWFLKSAENLLGVEEWGGASKRKRLRMLLKTAAKFLIWCTSVCLVWFTAIFAVKSIQRKKSGFKYYSSL